MDDRTADEIIDEVNERGKIRKNERMNDDLKNETANTLLQMREAFKIQKEYSEKGKNEIEIVRVWEAIQRMDNLLRQVESTAADAITIARLLAQQRGKK